MSDQTPRKSNNLVVILVLLLLAAGGLGFMYMQETNAKEKLAAEKAKVEDERNQLAADLEAKIAAFDNLQSEFNDSSAVLMNKKTELVKLLKELRSAKGDAATLRSQRNKLRLELASSQAIIDSITKENLALKMANDSLNTNLNDVSGKYSNLKEDYNSKMDIAKKLTLSNLIAEGRRVKTSDKFKVTTKAKKVNTIYVSFNVNENKLAESGPKNIYLRLLGPDGKVISIENKGSGKLRLIGVPEEVEFTTKKLLNYTNNNSPVSIEWTQNIPFDAGKYTAEIYSDGYKMGEKSFSFEE